MRPTRLAAVLAAALVTGACAQIEPPPGGPPDVAPPQLLAVRPDSVAVIADYDGSAEFVFDEVVGEGSSPNLGLGTGTLEQLVILSPSTTVPQVSWGRSRIGVRPREGWLPDRVYRIELRPGIADLRQNRWEGGPAVITFTTGAPVPRTVLTGRVVDWAQGRAAANAVVEAILLPDSLVYRTVTDSAGAFSFGPLPAGRYAVAGVIDANRNLRRDTREAYADTVLAAGDTAVGPLYAFVHDTLAPRGRAAAVVDSVRASLTATQPLRPGGLDSVRARVLMLPDSTRMVVTGVSLRTTPADTALPPGERPRLTDQVIIEVAQPWVPGTRYVLIAEGVRNVTGVPGELRAVLDVPARPAADSAAQ